MKPIDFIPRNHHERYFTLFDEFPKRAGSCEQSAATVRRQAQKMAARKWPEDVQKLILASAELVDAVEEFLPWMHAHIQAVANDADIVGQAGRREKLRNQAAIIQDFMARG